MVTTKLNLSMTEPSVRQIYAKQGDTGRVLDITLDQTPEDGTLRILRPDGVEVTSEAVTGGEVESGGTFDSLTEADVTELTVGIEPVQDLNGYDAPWVGGGGKNKLPLTLAILKANNTSGTWNGNVYTHNNGCVFTVGTNDGVTATTISVTGTASGGPCNFLLTNTTTHEELLGLRLNGCPSGGSGSTYFIGGYNLTDGTNAFLPDVGSGTTIPSTLSGKSFRIYIGILQGVNASGKVFYPMAYNSADGSAWQPYSNICPITGHDEVTVTRTGKNLCPTFTGGTASGLTYTVNEDGSVHVTGTNTGTAFWAVQLALPKGTYILSGAPSGGQLTIRNGEGGSAPSSAFSGTLDDYGNGATFTVSETASAWLNIRSTAGTHDKTYYPMIRLASETDTSYEPYRSNTYTTPLGQTVYGGTLDMATGVLTVDSRYLTVDDFSDYNGGVSGGGLHWVNVPKSYPTGVNDDASTNVCSHAPYSSNNVTGWGSRTPMYGVNSGGFPARMYVASASLADFRTEYATLQAVYKLAEPVTYQLTAQQIKTLVGTNNVWASSGDIVNIKFAYGGMLSELPSDATSVVGKCYCDVEQNGVSSMPFTLNVKKNERAT